MTTNEPSVLFTATSSALGKSGGIATYLDPPKRIILLTRSLDNFNHLNYIGERCVPNNNPRNFGDLGLVEAE